MKTFKVRIIKSWQDLDGIFKVGDIVDVYKGNSEFYFICSWGQYFIPKNHCEVI